MTNDGTIPCSNKRFSPPYPKISLRVSKSSFLCSVIKVIIYAVVYWYGHLHRFSLRVGCKRDPYELDVAANVLIQLGCKRAKSKQIRAVFETAHFFTRIYVEGTLNQSREHFREWLLWFRREGRLIRVKKCGFKTDISVTVSVCSRPKTPHQVSCRSRAVDIKEMN